MVDHLYYKHIIFKKFLIDKPKILKLILKHFLDLDGIQEITLTNPEIPELEEISKKEKKSSEKAETEIPQLKE